MSITHFQGFALQHHILTSMYLSESSVQLCVISLLSHREPQIGHREPQRINDNMNYKEDFKNKRKAILTDLSTNATYIAYD